MTLVSRWVWWAGDSRQVEKQQHSSFPVCSVMSERPAGWLNSAALRRIPMQKNARYA